MYRKPTGQISLLEDFRFFAGGKLDANNRWVKMADLIPWDVVEDRYAEQFPKHTRNVAKPVRVALGALIEADDFVEWDKLLRKSVAFRMKKPYDKSWKGG